MRLIKPVVVAFAAVAFVWFVLTGGLLAMARCEDCPDHAPTEE